MQSGSYLNTRSNLYLIPGESFEMTSGVCNLCSVKSFLIWTLHNLGSPAKLCWNVWGFCRVALWYKFVRYASFNWHTYPVNLLNWDISWDTDARPVLLNTHNCYLTGPLQNSGYCLVPLVIRCCLCHLSVTVSWNLSIQRKYSLQLILLRIKYWVL